MPWQVVRVRFSHITLIASLAGGLAQYHDTLGVALVDSVLEEVRWALDHPAAGRYQHLLAEMRLLGELYNYMLLDSRAVFDVLYTLLGHGHSTWEQAARLDPPDEYFRLRMVRGAGLEGWGACCAEQGAGTEEIGDDVTLAV
jgi:regulator of nonsense transcripts 2